MSERGFSHKNKYSLILCKIFKKAVKDTIQHEKFNNHVTFYTPILRTGKQFKKNRKVIDTFSLIHYDLHLYNLHSKTCTEIRINSKLQKCFSLLGYLY